MNIIFFSELISSDYLPKASGSNVPDLVNITFGIFGAIAVIMVIYSGIQFILSQGNPEKIAQARRSIIYAIAGLVIITFSWTIVSFVVRSFN